MAIKKELEIKYVAMPISVEQKKEYNAQGFRVIDIRFKPADLVETEQTEKDTPVRRRRRNVETDEE